MSENTSDLRGRLDSVIEASREYGGIDNIPEAVLAIHGYKRVAEGRLAPMELETPLVSQDEQLPDSKEALRPFGKVDVEVPVTGEAYITSLTYPLVADYLDRYFGYSSPKNYHEKIFPANHPLHHFITQIAPYDEIWRAKEGLDPDEEYKEGPINSGNWDIYPDVQSEYLSYQIGGLDPSEFLGEKVHQEGNINSQEAERLWQDLETTKSKVSDRDQQYKNYEYDYGWRDAAGNFKPEEFSADMLYFKGFLGYMGLPEIGEQIENAKSPQHAVQVLREATSQLPRISELKKAQSELKASGHGLSTENEREDYRKKMKELKAEERQLKETLSGLAAFFAVPETICEYSERAISKIQKNILVSGQEGTMNITFDANHDPEKDANPGSVSGDCTEGKPLPFADSTIPVFNVKAYEGNRHFGNIYLLATNDSKGRKAWHLEAIQLPNKRIAWNEFPKALVDVLSQQAIEKGIDMITINSFAPHISNYDYISHAFMKFAGKKVGDFVPPNDEDDDLLDGLPAGFGFNYEPESDVVGDVNIRVPEVYESERYSSFQGSGQATVIWAHESK